MPKLRESKLFENDIVFSEGDAAADIFFVLTGNILLLVDLTSIVDMKGFVKDDSSFNLPFTMCTIGSYLGDNDTLLGNNGNRTISAIAQNDC